MMEHNSNYVPWYAMCREILPRFGRRVHYRLARFDPVTGELDLDHLASLIDARTKLVCCTGASNFLGTKNPLRTIRALANASGYRQPSGERRSHLLVDGAQLVIRVDRACDLRMTVETEPVSTLLWFPIDTQAPVIDVSIGELDASQCAPARHATFDIPQRYVHDGLNVVTLSTRRLGTLAPRADLRSLHIACADR